MATVTIRMNTEARKQQIVQAALEAIGEYGIQGATISRIAKGAGITPAALYSHFENRRAILIAALDEVYGQIADSHRAPWTDDPVEQFRQICESHAQKVLSQDKTSHAHLFLEFVASAPEEGLREVLREKELGTKTYLASIVERFQAEGRVAKEVDAEKVAWLVACWAWTGDVANMMDATEIWHEKVSSHLMESILEVLKPGLRASAQGANDSEPLAQPAAEVTTAKELPAVDTTDYDGLPDGVVFTLEEAAGILKTSPDTIGEMVRLNQIRALSLGDQTRIARRTLLALLRGVSEEEFDAVLERRTPQSVQGGFSE
jgi:excisionase family DNA binding protein